MERLTADQKKVLIRVMQEHRPRPQYPDVENGQLVILCLCSDLDEYTSEGFRDHLAVRLLRELDPV